MIIGFSGTRRGMSLAQKRVFLEVLSAMAPERFVHGLCMGADVEAHDLVRSRYTPEQCPIEGYPSTDPSTRRYRVCELMHHPMDPMKRNRDIILSCEILIATPLEMEEMRRGGTWATIRVAEADHTPAHIIFRDGIVEVRTHE